MDLAVALSGFIILSISNSSDIKSKCFLYSGSLTLAMAYLAPSFFEIVQSLKKIASLDGNLIVYPGHDRQSTLDFERANNPFLNRA